MNRRLRVERYSDRVAVRRGDRQRIALHTLDHANRAALLRELSRAAAWLTLSGLSALRCIRRRVSRARARRAGCRRAALREKFGSNIHRLRLSLIESVIVPRHTRRRRSDDDAHEHQ